MKGNAEKGLSEHSKISEKPKELGMDSKGKAQIPMGVEKGKVSTDRGSFNVR